LNPALRRVSAVSSRALTSAAGSWHRVRKRSIVFSSSWALRAFRAASSTRLVLDKPLNPAWPESGPPATETFLADESSTIGMRTNIPNRQLEPVIVRGEGHGN